MKNGEFRVRTGLARPCITLEKKRKDNADFDQRRRSMLSSCYHGTEHHLSGWLVSIPTFQRLHCNPGNYIIDDSCFIRY